MTAFIEFSRELRALQPYDFEVVCNDYLKARYPTLTPWISTNVPSTIKGTPDAFLIDTAGDLIACQHGRTDRWRSKLMSENEKDPGDAKRVATLAKACGLTVSQLIFCTTAELELEEINNTQREAEQRFGFPVEICDLRRLASDLEVIYPGIAARRLGIPIPLQHFMTLDDYLDSSNQRYWPKRRHIDNDLLYSPEEYIARMRGLLLLDGKCLVTGESGAGKTVLSIAFALQWRKEHPEAAIFYLDADGDRLAEIGEDWYRQVLTYDYQNSLYLIDNSHLSVTATNAFCRQWEARTAQQARLILISRPRAETSEWEKESEDYFDEFESAGTILPVTPESIYQGMLRVYSDAYQRRDKARYVSVGDELADAEIAGRLEAACGHNLVFAHYLLEVWEREGGRLSDITDEKVLDRLSQRYLPRQMNQALPTICALAQFEILSHSEFVHHHLPADQIERALAEKLLFVENTQLYGECYRLSLHPQNAALIFRADVKRRLRTNYAMRVDAEIFSTLKDYLASQPENFANVYYRIYRSGNIDFQRQLLSNDELQKAAVGQFEHCTFNDMASYLYALSQTNSQRAEALLDDFTAHISPDYLLQKVESLNGTPLTWAAHCLVRVNRDAARKLFAGLEAKDIARRISGTNLGSIRSWISSSSNSVAFQLGYTETWRCEVAESLDHSQLALQTRQTGFASLFWFMRDLKSIAPSQAKALLDSWSPEDLGQKMSKGGLSSIHSFFSYLGEMGYDANFRQRVAASLEISTLVVRTQQQSLQQLCWIIRDLKSIAPSQAKALLDSLSPEDLAEKMSESDLSSAERLFRYLDDLDYDIAFCRRISESLELSALAVQSRQESLQHLYWFIRALKNVDPKQATRFEDFLTPKGLSEKFNDGQGTVTDLNGFWKVCSRGFIQQVFGHFNPGEISDIFGRSKLGEIGSFLEYRYHIFSQVYADFANRHLPAKMEEAPTADLGRFIARIYRVPQEGKQLARDALELLLSVDMTARVAKNDVEGIAGLLYSAYTVDNGFSRRLVASPGMPEAIEKGLKHSGIQGIQLLLHNLALVAPDMLQRVGGALQTLDLTNQLAAARIGDIAYFLGNVLEHIDMELARKYCQIVDSQTPQKQISKATLEELGRFLWNLVHISDADIQTLNEPLILKRLHEEWSVNFPQCVYTLGIIACARPNAMSSLDLPAVDLAQMSGELNEWLVQALDEEKPYLFALSLRGLLALSESWFNDVISEFQRDWKTKLRCLALLKNAESQAHTEKSRMLLKEVLIKLSK